MVLGETEEELRLLISYRTIVGYIKGNKKVTYNGDFISRSTASHVKLFKRFYGEGRSLDGEAFAAKLAQFGYSALRDEAPVSF